MKINKELLADSIAEEILLVIKPYCPTDLTYLYNNMEDGDSSLELKFTPKGEYLKEKILNIVLNNLENE